MKKFKESSKKYLIGFILGLIVCGSVSAIAMTYFPSNQTIYDNSTSGLESTNVQGAIDELYNVCFPPTPAGDQILDNTDIVTSGDGLYEDEYEKGKYTYKGANPNNYVTFNNEEAGWRIISINSDGTIKIMRDMIIAYKAWYSSNSNNWASADLNTYLNSTYYSGLNSTAQSQIVSKDFSIGAVQWNDTSLSNSINNENSRKWNGKVALATASEYIRSNSNQGSCGNMNQLWSSTSCGNTTWMYDSTIWWTLSPYFGYSGSVFYVTSTSSILNTSTYTSNGVRPVVYLSAEVQITGGDGSQSNPYTIE